MRRLAILIAPCVLLLTGGVALGLPRFTANRVPVAPASVPPLYRGQLRISHFGSSPAPREAQQHVSVYVRGSSYTGMEDNDIRGFLDGTVKWGWNQVSQVHVRLGRRGESPAHGGYELFRILQRWDSIALPPYASVTGVHLSIAVEVGAERPLTVLLYPVTRDWSPGVGGLNRNNSSPPRHGEVWWNEAEHGIQGWGLPGASFASDQRPDADTEVSPLAEHLYRPGDSTITFSSERLSQYAARRLLEQKPLLFLIKLADYEEDIPGTALNLYSANADDSRTLRRRPRLTLNWYSTSEEQARTEFISLEYGRTHRFRSSVPAGAQHHALSFSAHNGSPYPTILVRGGRSADTSEWQPVQHPFRAEWDWMEVALLGATNVVNLGRPFLADASDTWVRTAPPRDQQVKWKFISPTGQVHTVDAQYAGQYRWTVKFEPDELGRWRYYWNHNFTDATYRSPMGIFDVILGNREEVLSHLAVFKARVKRESSRADTDQRERLMIQFARLERAALQFETPESFRSSSGRQLRRELAEIRTLLEASPPSAPSLLLHRLLSKIN